MMKRDSRQLPFDFSGKDAAVSASDAPPPIEKARNLFRLEDRRRESQLEDVRVRLMMSGVFPPRHSS